MRLIRDSIRENNKIYRQLKFNIDQLQEHGNDYEQYRIVFLDEKPAGAMPRTYNKPKCAEVALITSSDLESSSQNYKRSVVITLENSGRLQEIPFSHPAYFPLCYPLFYFTGEQGWYINMKSESDPSKKITMREYGAYLLQIRDKVYVEVFKELGDIKIQYDTVLCGNALTQQFVDDLYISVENDRLLFLRLNQKKLKVELYQGLIDAVASREQRLAGKYVILPATHVGSPRWYYTEFQDAMARVRVLGKPELFITFTCNPNWPEIKESMKGFESGTNSRPDLIARVFEMKLQYLMKTITEEQGFGVDTGFMYTMEWQKRGLPHAHILIFLRKEDAIRSTEDIDKVVSAEFPDPITQPLLYNLVSTHMVHGPCGIFNSKSPCCDTDGNCSKRFPFKLTSKTQITEDSYPIYRRRSPKDGGHSYQYQKSKKEDPIFLNNGWVVPYNGILLKNLEAHLNVEICSTVKAVKYIHKYIFKGSDKAQIKLVQTNNTGKYNIVLMMY